MKIRYILLLIITIWGMNSCYDDKGNYSYDPKNGFSLGRKFLTNGIWNGWSIPWSTIRISIYM